VTLLEKIEKFSLTVVVIGVVTALIFTNKIDATSGLAYIIAAAGINLTGTVASNVLSQPSVATGALGSQPRPVVAVPVESVVAPVVASNVPLGGPGNPGV
jgi:hypothetical protein